MAKMRDIGQFMNKFWSQVISPEFGVATLVAIVLAIAEMTWYLRIGLTVLGVALIAFLAWRRMEGPKWMRVVFAAVGSAVLVALSVGPIQNDIEKERMRELNNNLRIYIPWPPKFPAEG